MILRIGAGALGIVLAAYGVVLLVTRQDAGQVRDAVIWLIGGVLLHDGLLVPIVIALGLVAGILLTPARRRVATAMLVVLGPVTLLAVPVLGRFGARSDNPTLLDRPYLPAWIAFLVGVLAVGVIADRVVRSRGGNVNAGEGASTRVDERLEERAEGAADGTGAGGR